STNPGPRHGHRITTRGGGPQRAEQLYPHEASLPKTRRRPRTSCGGVVTRRFLGLLLLRLAGRLLAARGGDAHRRGVRDVQRLGLTAEGEPGLIVALVADLPTLDVHDDDLAGLDLAEQDLLGQLVL